MDQALLTMGPSMVSSIALTGIFAVLWRHYREDYLGIWALAWALFAARYLYGFGNVVVDYVPGAFVVPLLALARGYVMLWGAHAMVHRTVPKAWGVLFLTDFGLLVLDVWTGLDLRVFGVEGVTHYSLFGTALIVSGMILAGRLKTPGWGPQVAGAGLALIGVLQFLYPWTPVMPGWFRTGAYLLVQAGNLAMAVGVMMAFFAESQAQVQALNARLATTLGTLVPLCSKCHSVQEEDSGDWQSLERYMTEHTGSRISHGICPTCEDEMYGTFLNGPSQPAAAGDARPKLVG